MEEIKVIELNSNPRSIIKVGLTIRAIFLLMPGLAVLIMGLNFFKDSPTVSIICFAIGLFLCYIFFRILNRAFFKEFLTLTKQDITVTLKTLTNEKKYVFPLDEIRYFGFSDQKYTDHPMDNSVLDITGLGAREKELQYVIDEGNIKIQTLEKAIKFGKNLPSWDVEEIIQEVELYTGKKFLSFKLEIPLEVPLPSDEAQIDPEMEKETPNVEAIRFTYSCDQGELVIEQKYAEPSSEDVAYLNGRLAPTGKYQIGEKKVVLVSNGIVYAIRT